MQADAVAAKAQVDVIVERHRKTCARAMEILSAGVDDALSFFGFPVEHHRKLWSTNPIEQLNRHIRRRTRAVGIFPNVASALRLITMVLIEQTEEWQTERRYVIEESMQSDECDESRLDPYMLSGLETTHLFGRSPERLSAYQLLITN